MNRIPIEPGRVVISLAGRDEGRRFVVIEADEGYAMIADGDLRKVDRPKKKKRKHLRATQERIACVPDAKRPMDHEIRRALTAIAPEEEG